MNSSAKRWLIGICTGVSLTSAFYCGRYYVHRNDKYTKMAHLLHVDADKWADLNVLFDKSQSQHTLSDSELDRIQVWLGDANSEVSTRALFALRTCSLQPARTRALALTRSCLSSSKSIMRRKAVYSLVVERDPTLVKDVSDSLKDPDADVRAEANDALKGVANGASSASPHP